MTQTSSVATRTKSSLIFPNMLLSIIVPVYNAQLYLSSCIESILCQSFSDFELILINDGSTDTSGDICDSYALQDSRVKVIHQNNSGVSAARNAGIRKARGHFICFVDADDSIERDYLQNFSPQIKPDSSDIVVQGLKICLPKGEIEEIISFTDTPPSSLSAVLNKQLIQFRGPYCKLFKTSIINKYNISFPQSLQYGEDSIFYLNYLLHCSTIKVLSCNSYRYTKGVNASLSALNHPVEQILFFHEKNAGLIKSLQTKHKLQLPYNVFFNMISFKGIISLAIHQLSQSNFIDFVTKLKKSELINYLHRIPSSFKDRAILTLFRCLPSRIIFYITRLFK